MLEVIVSRTRYISKELGEDRACRVLGLSTALANPHDLADWLGVDPRPGHGLQVPGGVLGSSPTGSQLGLGANLTMDLNSMEEYPIQCPVPSGMSSIAQVPLIIASDMGHRDRRVPNRFHFGRPPTRVGCH